MSLGQDMFYLYPTLPLLILTIQFFPEQYISGFSSILPEGLTTLNYRQALLIATISLSVSCSSGWCTVIGFCSILYDKHLLISYVNLNWIVSWLTAIIVFNSLFWLWDHRCYSAWMYLGRIRTSKSVIFTPIKQHNILTILILLPFVSQIEAFKMYMVYVYTKLMHLPLLL